ncbi:MAG: ABC transporter permease, partial [Chrysiogenales bacterium]
MSMIVKPKIPRFLGLAAAPPVFLKTVLVALPFILCLGLYLAMSHVRHSENPRDKILPTFSQMADAVHRIAFQKDSRTGTYLMLGDTLSSMGRLLLGIAIASLLGLILGIHMGIFPGIESLSSAFVTVVSIIPPLSILPILFITLGVDELAKVS